MSAQVIYGKPLALRAMERLEEEVRELAREGHTPHLVPLSVGHSVSSDLYVKRQQEWCRRLGIDCTPVRLAEETAQEELEIEIHKLNGDPSVTGITLQMPLPKTLDARSAQRLIAPSKDVEGVTPASLGAVVLGDESLAPTAARAAFELAEASGRPMEGTDAVIVGHSEIVGKPLSLLFLKAFATTTVCHIATRNLAEYTRKADFLCIAVGKPGLITGEMIKPGAVVVDIGFNRVPKAGPGGRSLMKTVGDVDFDSASKVAGWITPVPGGVGQLTIAMLLSNTVKAAARRLERTKAWTI